MCVWVYGYVCVCGRCDYAMYPCIKFYYSKIKSQHSDSKNISKNRLKLKQLRKE